MARGRRQDEIEEAQPLRTDMLMKLAQQPHGRHTYIAALGVGLGMSEAAAEVSASRVLEQIATWDDAQREMMLRERIELGPAAVEILRALGQSFLDTTGRADMVLPAAQWIVFLACADLVLVMDAAWFNRLRMELYTMQANPDGYRNYVAARVPRSRAA